MAYMKYSLRTRLATGSPLEHDVCDSRPCSTHSSLVTTKTVSAVGVDIALRDHGADGRAHAPHEYKYKYKYKIYL
jgi:hypothetical protein